MVRPLQVAYSCLFRQNATNPGGHSMVCTSGKARSSRGRRILTANCPAVDHIHRSRHSQVADQVGRADIYRREVLMAIERTVPGSGRFLAGLHLTSMLRSIRQPIRRVSPHRRAFG